MLWLILKEVYSVVFVYFPAELIRSDLISGGSYCQWLLILFPFSIWNCLRIFTALFSNNILFNFFSQSNITAIHYLKETANFIPRKKWSLHPTCSDFSHAQVPQAFVLGHIFLPRCFSNYQSFSSDPSVAPTQFLSSLV